MPILELSPAVYDARVALLRTADLLPADVISSSVVERAQAHVARLLPRGSTEIAAQGLVAAKLIEAAARRWSAQNGVDVDTAREALRSFIDARPLGCAALTIDATEAQR